MTAPAASPEASHPTERPQADPALATLTIGSLALVIVYAVLVPVDLLVIDGVAHGVVSALAVVSCVGCGAIWWWATHPRRSTDARTGRWLLVMCLVPIGNGLVHVALARQLAPTTVLMLTAVGVAAVLDRAAQIVALVATTCIAWVLIVVVLRPGPVSETGSYAIGMALAGALGTGIFLIRAATTRRLVATRDELVRELAESGRLRTEALASGERFQSVFADSPVAMGLGDQDGVLLEVNRELCTLFGRPRQEVVGRPFLDFMHPEELASLEEAEEAIRSARDGVASAEKRYVRPSGEMRWGWVTFRHLAGPEGQNYTLAHIQDITERKAGEEKLRQSREVMRAMVEIAHASQQDRDPRPPVLATLTALVRAHSVCVLESTAPGQLSVTSSNDGSLVGTTVELDDPSVSAHVWQTGKALFVSEARSHPLVNQRLLELSGASSMLWQPVMSDETILAVLALTWADSLSDVTDFERQAVAAVAAEAAVALMAERMRQQLRTVSVTDPLTGLLNRRGWDGAVAEMAAQAKRTGACFTIAIVDLDHFKLFNDAHGHLRGDDALVHFAAQARTAVRGTDLVARWGGEEFAVALRDTSGEAVAGILERLHAAPPPGLTCSIGYAEARPGDDVERCLTAADDALFVAKQSGRNRSVAAPSALAP